MKLAIILAFRNLKGAGLRTWLNVIVLSFSFVIIIWMKGIMTGWDYQAKTDMKNWETGSGQYWHEKYDPYDPFTLTESHSVLPDTLKDVVKKGEAEPVLIAQGTIYPQGRMQAVRIKGINPAQKIFRLPTLKLDTAVTDAIPAIIGGMMAKNLNASVGDRIMLQWRDANGTFDASEVLITGIFNVSVPAIDHGQIYIPLEKLRSMLGLADEATIITFMDQDAGRHDIPGWVYKPFEVLTAQVDKMIKMKSSSQTVFYMILLLLAMLAIFDTQVLSIFRRQREIGTYIAIGYTRSEVVGLFTVEGTMYSVFAALLATAYGLPFLAWQAKTGWTMPVDTSQLGMAIAQTLYPVFTAGLVVSTVLLIMLTTAIVSYWPSRKIAKMNPTEALRGKIR
ncbi:MAG TPA: FtsX-like permease family protein [Bacteroidales bacterium]|nr:FtsX-like permease family protein [Bacteroidales bacterium]